MLAGKAPWKIENKVFSKLSWTWPCPSVRPTSQSRRRDIQFGSSSQRTCKARTPHPTITNPIEFSDKARVAVDWWPWFSGSGGSRHSSASSSSSGSDLGEQLRWWELLVWESKLGQNQNCLKNEIVTTCKMLSLSHWGQLPVLKLKARTFLTQMIKPGWGTEGQKGLSASFRRRPFSALK